MKFTNGYWLTADGCTVHAPKQLYDYEYDGSRLRLYLPVSKVSHRGDTLNAMLLTLSLSAPVEGIIRVTATHHCGENQKKAAFRLNESTNHCVFEKNDTDLTFASGRLKARIPLSGPFGIQYELEETPLTSSMTNGLAFVETAHEPRIKEEISLSVGETVYGLGERFGPFVKNGQSIVTINSDGGTASEQAYKNIPFYVTNQRYGIFVNHPEPVDFEIATEKVHRVQFSVPGQRLDYFIISGMTPKEILTRYTQLTGRPPLLPAWSFGLWLSTSFLTAYDEGTVTEIITEMKQRDLPVDVFHFDCFWMKEFHWCDFRWDERMFPDPRGMLARLHALGLKICLWINPYIAQRSPLFEEGRRNNYLLRKKNGDVWQTDQWQAGMGIVDFTNPQARKWYAFHLQQLLDMGVDSFKTDFGERIPLEEVIWHDGSHSAGMRNFYSFLYNQVVYDLLKQNAPSEAVLFARAATAGGQQFPVHWGGDCESTFDGMAQSLRGGLSLGLSGFGYWSHDIGGFEGTPPVEVYKRWLPFGLLSSHSRLHGSHSYRVPWVFDEEAVDVLGTFTRLKLNLMPYLFQLAVESHRTGIPMLRAMLLEFPEDPTCEFLDRQYMLGHALLVAPVMNVEGSAQFYLPPGRWTEWFSGRWEQGGRWIKHTYDFLQLPFYVRENTILPTAIGRQGADYDYLNGTIFKVFAPLNGQTKATVFGPDGRTTGIFSMTKTSDAIHFEVSDEFSGWRVELYHTGAVTALEHCSVTLLENKTLIAPEKNQCLVGLKESP